jgi:hypothetical protein
MAGPSPAKTKYSTDFLSCSAAKFPAVAPCVFRVSRTLTAVEIDNQMPLATNEIGVVPIDGLRAYNFEAAELPSANAGPQTEFCWRERAPQRSRPLGALLVLAQQLSSFTRYNAGATQIAEVRLAGNERSSHPDAKSAKNSG